MKNRWKQNPLLRIVILLVALVLIGVVSGIGLFYYAFSIPEPEGLSPATWPNRFTENFSTWMENEDGGNYNRGYWIRAAGRIWALASSH